MAVWHSCSSSGDPTKTRLRKTKNNTSQNQQNTKQNRKTMKKNLMVLIAFFVLFGCQSDELKESKKQKVIVSSLIVRATPNKEGKPISKLEYGSVLTTIAKSMHKDTIQIKGIREEAHWYKIEENGMTGWVFGGCLSDKFPKPDRLKIDAGTISSGQIWICNDTLINCKIDQKDQETEIYVYNISFLDQETAIIHDFSSAGHTDEVIEKVKYKIEDNLLKIQIPDKRIVRDMLSDDEDAWEIEKSEPYLMEFELEKCGRTNIFRIVGYNFYCGQFSELEYQESYKDIDSLINIPSVKKLLSSIK
jgi:uncharacterized protein YcfL